MMQSNRAIILPMQLYPVPNGRSSSALPHPLTSFLGREKELETICKLLQQQEVRLLTLTGPGGVGKTRLALAAASHLLGSFPDGLFFLPFVSLREPDLVLSTIARELALNEPDGLCTPFEHLQMSLKSQSLLLILDNFEHLSTAAPLLVHLLQVCPFLKMLVTSRAMLRVQGEHVFDVLPFILPDNPSLPSLEQLLHSTAIRLFVERARSLQADFELTRSNCAVVAKICTRLDGLPLAIELAAARIPHLSPTMIFKRLEQRFQLLNGGGQDVHWRQQTLRNTIQWSYDLLNQEEQRFFRLFSVFANGASLEAVEAIAATSNIIVEHVINIFGSLIDKSLLQRNERENGEQRLIMLETIRAYGLELLQTSGEAEQLRQRHAEYFLALAEEAEPKLASAQQVNWLKRLELEYENLRVALDWLLEAGKMELALRLASALWPFWAMYDHMEEGYYWLQKTLAGHDEVPAFIRARALYAKGSFFFLHDDYSRAFAACEESLALLRELEDRESMALVLNGLGQVALVQRRYDLVHQFSTENLLLVREIGDPWKTAEALFLSAYSLLARGEYSQARAAAEESLVLCKGLGQPRAFARVLYTVGYIAQKQHDFPAADARYQESLSIAQEVDEQRLMVACFIGLAEIAAVQGNYSFATRLWGHQKALHDTIHARRSHRTDRPDEQIVAMTRFQLGEEAFRAAWLQGQSMTLAQILELIRDEAQGAEHAHRSSEHDAVSTPSQNSRQGKSGNAQHLPPPAGLTLRESEVLRLVAQGLTNAQIAEQLVVSPLTINTHIRAIYRKLGISSRSAATRYALEHHLA